MGAVGQRTQPVRDRGFLKWAKEQGGLCCVCRWLFGGRSLGVHLHHFGDKGMGQKGSDHLVARVCEDHHRLVQGKRWLAFGRDGDWSTLAALQRDALELLSGYVSEQKEPS